MRKFLNISHKRLESFLDRGGGYVTKKYKGRQWNIRVDIWNYATRINDAFNRIKAADITPTFYMEFGTQASLCAFARIAYFAERRLTLVILVSP